MFFLSFLNFFQIIFHFVFLLFLFFLDLLNCIEQFLELSFLCHDLLLSLDLLAFFLFLIQRIYFIQPLFLCFHMLAKSAQALFHLSYEWKLFQLEMFDQKLQDVLKQKSNFLMETNPERTSPDGLTSPLEICCSEFFSQVGAKLYSEVAYTALHFESIDCFQDHQENVFS